MNLRIETATTIYQDDCKMAVIETDPEKHTHICKYISDELLEYIIETYNVKPYTYTVGSMGNDNGYDVNYNLKPIRKNGSVKFMFNGYFNFDDILFNKTRECVLLDVESADISIEGDKLHVEHQYDGLFDFDIGNIHILELRAHYKPIVSITKLAEQLKVIPVIFMKYYGVLHINRNGEWESIDNETKNKLVLEFLLSREHHAPTKGAHTIL